MKGWKLFVMDVDGTMTDGAIYIGESGEAFKAFDSKDGYAISVMLPELGIKTAIITGRSSKIVEHRAKELKIDYLYQGARDKWAALESLMKEEKLKPAEVLYMGDDIPDLACMKRCGYSCCPADAVEEIRRAAGYVALRPAGKGAIRECIEWIKKYLS